MFSQKKKKSQFVEVLVEQTSINTTTTSSNNDNDGDDDDEYQTMGTAASVQQTLTVDQAKALAGPLWSPELFQNAASSSENADTVSRNAFLDQLCQHIAGTAGITLRGLTTGGDSSSTSEAEQSFWQRVNMLFLYMDSAVGGSADGKITVDELKAFFGGSTSSNADANPDPDADANAKENALYYLSQIDAYAKNQGYITLDELYGYFDYLGGPTASGAVEMLESFEAWEGYAAAAITATNDEGGSVTTADGKAIQKKKRCVQC